MFVLKGLTDQERWEATNLLTTVHVYICYEWQKLHFLDWGSAEKLGSYEVRQSSDNDCPHFLFVHMYRKSLLNSVCLPSTLHIFCFGGNMFSYEAGFWFSVNNMSGSKVLQNVTNWRMYILSAFKIFIYYYLWVEGPVQVDWWVDSVPRAASWISLTYSHVMRHTSYEVSQTHILHLEVNGLGLVVKPA